MDKLNRIIDFALQDNEYYIKKFNDKPKSIDDFSILTRLNLQNEKHKMISNTYKLKYESEHLLRQSSSGSTGMPISVYWDYNNWYASNLVIWRKRKKWYNIFPNDKRVIFTLNAYNIRNDNDKIMYLLNSNILSINIASIDNDKKFIELINLINKFEPKWLYIQPSILEKIIFICKKYNIKIINTLIYIEAVGEILSNNLKENAKKFFNVSVANMYGSEEMNAIAFECPCHNMHILTDNVFVEVYDGEIKKEGKGNAIITSLNNYAMPLIRYNQEDEIELTNVIKCKCGEESPIIKNIYGRKCDIIRINNVEINPYFLIEIMGELINMYNDVIKSYSYIYYKSKKKLVAFLSLNGKYKNWSMKLENALKDLFMKKNYCRYIDFKIEFKDIENNIGKRQIIKILE